MGRTIVSDMDFAKLISKVNCLKDKILKENSAPPKLRPYGEIEMHRPIIVICPIDIAYSRL